MTSTETDRERFLAKVSTSGAGCWEWLGHVMKNGYGQFWFDGRVITAHRASVLILTGTDPGSDQVDHLCRNRSCVNPRHLEVVTQQENCRRMGLAVTRCPQGHVYPDPTPVPGHGKRCRVCDRERTRARRRRAAEAARFDAEREEMQS